MSRCAKGCPELFDENESGTQLKDVLALLLKVCRCTGHKLKRVNLKRLPGDNYNLEEIMDSECPSGLEDSD